MDLFARMLSFILRPDHEGGYSNDPRDPGGETNKGITKRVAEANGYFGDMREIPDAVVEAIYRKDYWGLCRCGDMPVVIAALVFDSAVNQGQGGAGSCIQRAYNSLGTGIRLAVDGEIGPATVHALQMLQAERVGELADLFAAERAQRYAQNENVSIYGTGWMRRLMRCHRLAIELGEQK